MKAALLTYSVSRVFGGVYEVTRRAAQSLAEQPDMRVDVFSLEDQFTSADVAQWQPLAPHTFPHRGPRLCGYAPGLARALEQADADVLHVHGIWSYYSLAGRAWSRRQHRPYLLTTHGMLSARSLDVARWKKFFAAAVFKNTVLRSAQCLQAFSEHEVSEIRDYGLRNPVCVIPNGIDLPGRAPTEPPPWCDHVEPGTKVLLYLGRLHPIKGLPDLLRGWAEFRRRSGTEAKNWNLAIAGWGESGHEAELKVQAQAASLSDSVHFLGPQFGDDKAAAYHHADAFVLPSLSEGLPTAVLEAWAHGRPVLMTPECNLPVGFETGSALRLDREPSAMAESLAQLCALSDTERAAMGARGRLLVAERFAWRKVAAQLRDVYEWLAGGGPTPACVTLN